MWLDNFTFDMVVNACIFIFSSWNSSNHTWEITEALKPIIGNFEFQRGGKTVFTAVNFAGYVGILTAVKPVRDWWSLSDYHQNSAKMKKA